MITGNRTWMQMKETSKPKLCKDCKYYRRDFWSLRETECRSPSNTVNNSVTGGTKFVYKGAETLRYFDELCGEEAKWFEAKK